MASLTVVNEFVNGTIMDAPAMNVNTAAVRTFLNTEPLNRDGTIPLTGVVAYSANQTTVRWGANLNTSTNASLVTGVDQEVMFSTLGWKTGISAAVAPPTGSIGLVLASGIYLIQLSAQRSGLNIETYEYNIAQQGTIPPFDIRTIYSVRPTATASLDGFTYSYVTKVNDPFTKFVAF